MQSHTFEAVIYQIGINRCVDIPESLSNSMSSSGFVAINILLNNQKYQTTLIPRGGGRHRLFLNSTVRKMLYADTGDKVKICIEPDPAAGEISEPTFLTRFLNRHKVADDIFRKLTPSQRREIIRYVQNAKTEFTRKKYLQHLLRILIEKS